MKKPGIETSATATHWRNVWAGAEPEKLSWHQDVPAASLELIAAAGLRRDAAIIDVGGGCSALAQGLLERGYHHVAVLDVSEAALSLSAERMGPLGDDVSWIEADIRHWRPVPGLFDLWHDRAVLHFLTRAEDQARYVEVLKRALGPEGQVVIGVFAPDGPERCSGLAVQRHDGASLLRLLGDGFQLAEERRETHLTPGGREQCFQWIRCVRR